ncbi:hypothetical protein B0H14DRAFT_464168 [Mycena olivaceomarginata]|nr:hypothetical protein B0H14DRAFT_464168 [Mycena olivaceomarginata]
MHTKMIIGSFTQKKNATSESSGPAGWMYVGSTAPAWGNLSGSADAPMLNVNNYELGVVVPLMTPEEVNIASAWERPPSKYTAEDGPWLFSKIMRQADFFFRASRFGKSKTGRSPVRFSGLAPF